MAALPSEGSDVKSESVAKVRPASQAATGGQFAARVRTNFIPSKLDATSRLRVAERKQR